MDKKIVNHIYQIEAFTNNVKRKIKISLTDDCSFLSLYVEDVLQELKELNILVNNKDLTV